MRCTVLARSYAAPQLRPGRALRGLVPGCCFLSCGDAVVRLGDTALSTQPLVLLGKIVEGMVVEVPIEAKINRFIKKVRCSPFGIDTILAETRDKMARSNEVAGFDNGGIALAVAH